MFRGGGAEGGPSRFPRTNGLRLRRAAPERDNDARLSAAVSGSPAKAAGEAVLQQKARGDGQAGSRLKAAPREPRGGRAGSTPALAQHAQGPTRDTGNPALYRKHPSQLHGRKVLFPTISGGSTGKEATAGRRAGNPSGAAPRGAASREINQPNRSNPTLRASTHHHVQGRGSQVIAQIPSCPPHLELGQQFPPTHVSSPLASMSDKSAPFAPSSLSAARWEAI